jgi:hypothetical protein
VISVADHLYLNIAGINKDIFQTSLGFLWLGEQVTSGILLGLTISFSAAAYYIYADNQRVESLKRKEGTKRD